MEREEERERRRVRDRQRRESMTKEQRERHLARRRRNYQLRRQRASNSNSCSASTSSNHTGLETLQILQGSSIDRLEGFPTNLRLNVIKRIARNLATPITLPPANNRIPTELISASTAHDHDIGSITKPSLRFNRVKRLARSLSFPAAQSNPNVNGMENGEGICEWQQLVDNHMLTLDRHRSLML